MGRGFLGASNGVDQGRARACRRERRRDRAQRRAKKEGGGREVCKESSGMGEERGEEGS